MATPVPARPRQPHWRVTQGDEGRIGMGDNVLWYQPQSTEPQAGLGRCRPGDSREGQSLQRGEEV